MKPLAGLLVEYFVVGAVALLWLIPVLELFPAFSGALASKDASGIIIALTVPAIYVVGMVCDLLGYWLTHWKKKQIDKSVWQKQNEKDPGSQIIHAYAVCYEPKLAEEIEARSSRDRVARGSLVAFFPLLFLPPASLPLCPYLLIVAFIIVCMTMLWLRFQTLSSKYEVKASIVLREKHKLNFSANAQPKYPADSKK